MVRRCINLLPDNYRIVLILRDIEELATEEVASLLDVTPSNVKVRLHRARQALKTLLERELTCVDSRILTSQPLEKKFCDEPLIDALKTTFGA